ncbi:unnamed protein product [Amoebophrya sp. A120]|nr:unnamed protein product [Amoebophrya sp. A120]|eukprot:GSA120T00004022001.1
MGFFPTDFRRRLAVEQTIFVQSGVPFSVLACCLSSFLFRKSERLRSLLSALSTGLLGNNYCHDEHFGRRNDRSDSCADGAAIFQRLFAAGFPLLVYFGGYLILFQKLFREKLLGHLPPQFSGDAARAGWRDFERYRLAAEYFYMKIVFDEDHDNDDPATCEVENYLFACHPHGFFVFSALFALSTNGALELRPSTELDGSTSPSNKGNESAGIKLEEPTERKTLVTVSQTPRAPAKNANPSVKDNILHQIRHNFRFAVADFPFVVPGMREYGLFTGAISPTVAAIRHNLSKASKARSVGLVIGGAQEALLAGLGDDKMRLIVKDRFGFVREALRARVKIVPVLHFGENALWEQIFCGTSAPPPAPAARIGAGVEAPPSSPSGGGGATDHDASASPPAPSVSSFVESFVRKLQLWQLNTLGIVVPLFWPGQFQLGFAPKKGRKLVTVFGKPFDPWAYLRLQGKVKSAPTATEAVPLGAEKDTGTAGVENTDLQRREQTHELERKTNAAEESSTVPVVTNEMTAVAHEGYLEHLRQLHSKTAPLYGEKCDQVLEFLSSEEAKAAMYQAHGYIGGGGQNYTTSTKPGTEYQKHRQSKL